MAGDTFDAGTVVAESRLDRDQLKRDIAAFKRDLIRLEREARVRIRPRFDGSELTAGITQANLLRAQLEQLHGMRVAPDVSLNGGAAARAELEQLERQIRQLNGSTARPSVNMRGGAQAAKHMGSMVSTGNMLVGVLAKVALGWGAVQVASLAGAAALQVAATAAGGLAVLPAILTGGIAILTAIKLGTKGVGDAMKAAAEGDVKALEEALKKLAPSAREFVLEVQKVSPAWRAMRLDVQQQLFIGLGAAIGTLTERYLPVLRDELPFIAAELRETALQTIAFANGSRQVDSVRMVLQATGAALDMLNPAFGWLLQALLDVAAVGSAFLPDLAAGFSGWARGVAESVAAMRESGELFTIIQRGLQTIYSLGGAINSVFGIVGGLLRAAGMDGQGLAISLATILQRWEDWVNSAAGQAVIGDFFRDAVTFAQVLGPLLGALAAAAGTLIDVLGPSLPAITQAITDIAVAGQPALDFFTQLASVVLPALASTVSFLAPVLGPMAVTIGAVAIASAAWGAATAIARGALLALNATVAIVRGAILAYNVILAIARGNIQLFAMAQWLLNAAMTANPIGVVVVILGALIAAIVLAWNHSETFRAVVMAAWAGIQTAAAAAWGFLQGVFAALVTATQAVGDAAVWLWQNALVPAWNGIVAVVQTAGQVFSWLWTTIIQPVFNFIGMAARILLAVLVTAVLAPIILAVKAAGAVFTWLWENAIRPAWEAISGFIVSTWEGYIRPALEAIGTFITTNVGGAWVWLRDTVLAVWTAITTAVSTAWNWLLTTILQPIIDFVVGQLTASWQGWQLIITTVWQVVSDAIGAAWAFIRDNVFNPIVAFLSATLGPAFEVARDAITTAWQAIQDALSVVWNWVKTNVFDPIVNFVTVTIPDAFQRAVDGIKGAWDKIQGIVGPPIKFMVNLVYNEGIVPAWNWIAGLVALPKLEKVALGFHSGGVVPGPSNPYADNRLARVNGGEAVMRPEWTRAVGPAYVDAMNRLAANGGPRAVLGAMNSGAMVEGADHNGPGSSTVGFGGVRPHVAQAGHYLKRRFGIGVVGGVGARANASDHPKGLALDFMTSGENGTQLADFVRGGTNKQHFGVTYVIWRQRIDSGSGWRGMANRGSPTANHMDHVHVSFGGPGSGPMGPGGGFDFMAKLIEMWKKVTDFMGRIGEFTSTQWGAGGMEMLKKLVSGAWDWLVGKATGGFLAPGTAPGANTGPAGAAGPGAGNFFDEGGYLPVGTSVVTNATGKPEPVLTAEQWKAITAPPAPPPMSTPISTGQFEQLSAVMTEVRDLLERRGTGATVNVNQQSDPMSTARAAVLQLRL